MFGLRADTDNAVRHLRSDNKSNFGFSNNLTNRFHVAGVSGSLQVKSQKKHHDEAISLKLEEIKANASAKATAPIDEEIKKDEERLSLLQRKLEEVRAQRAQQEIQKEQRQRERLVKKIQYLAATKLQRAFHQALFVRRHNATVVVKQHLRSKLMKQSITVAAWAAKVIKRFAIYVSCNLLLRRYLFHVLFIISFRLPIDG